MNKASIIAIVLIIAGGIAFTLLKPEPQPDAQNQGASAMSLVEVPIYFTGQSLLGGTATFADEGGKTKVTINMTEAPQTAKTASIMAGTCYEATVVRFKLNDVVNGKSETTLAPAMHFLHGVRDNILVVEETDPSKSGLRYCGSFIEAFDKANHVAQ